MLDNNQVKPVQVWSLLRVFKYTSAYVSVI